MGSNILTAYYCYAGLCQEIVISKTGKFGYINNKWYAFV